MNSRIRRRKQWALEGDDPEKVSLTALHKARLLWAAGEIPVSDIGRTAERLRREEVGEALVREEFIRAYDL